MQNGFATYKNSFNMGELEIGVSSPHYINHVREEDSPKGLMLKNTLEFLSNSVGFEINLSASQIKQATHYRVLRMPSPDPKKNKIRIELYESGNN